MLRKCVPALRRGVLLGSSFSPAPAAPERAAAHRRSWALIVEESMMSSGAMEEAYGMGRSEIHTQVELSILKRAFDEYDLDKNGVLDKVEIGKALEGLGLGHLPTDVDAIFSEYDANNDGVISLEEWLSRSSPCFRAAVLERFQAKCPV